MLRQASGGSNDGKLDVVFTPQTKENMAEKRKKTFYFHNDLEEEFYFTTVKEKCVSHLRGNCCDGKAAQCGETLQYVLQKPTC